MSLFALLCSGQGAQSPELFTRFPFTAAGNALRSRLVEASALDPDVAAWLDAPAARPEAVFLNRISQPVIALFHAMVWAELAPVLPRPAMVAGYSLGELSAYGCAGALDAETVVRLAGTRARLMDGAGPRGELLAVTGLSPATVAACPGALLAIVIGEDHCVAGCRAEQAPGLAEALRGAGAREVVMLAVTVASHTPLLDAAVEPFRAALAAAEWREPRFPILAGITAAKVLRREAMETTLPEQIHRTIRWDHVLHRLAGSGCRVALELGPGRQLAHMALAAGIEARSTEEFRTVAGMAAWVESALRRAG